MRPGNGNAAAIQLSVTNDETAPTITITASADPTSGAFIATFTFSEEVTGFTSDDISVSNGEASNFSATSAMVYTATITPAADGATTVDVAEDKAIDAAGNGNTAATQLSVTNDETVPTVMITSSTDPTSRAFTATFTFSEDVTGFELTDITVGNGTASNFGTTSASLYTATITPAADGATTVDVAADKATDAAGNGNTAATQLSVINDETLPSASISSSVSDITSGSFTVIVEYDETVSGFELSDLAITNGTAFGLTPIISGQKWSVDITPEADGVVTVDLAAGVVTDQAGNLSTAATTFSIVNDETQPSVVLTAGEPVDNSYTVTAQFSEAVSGFTVDDLTLSGGTVSTFQTMDKDTYNFKISSTGTGATVDIAADVATDDAGNGNTAAATLSLAFNVAPTDIGLSANHIDENNAVDATIGTFSATDANATDTHTYSLVAGTGDADNSEFSIVNDELRASASYDFETQSSYTIRVEVADNQGATFQKAFAVNVNDVAEPGIAISGDTDFGTSALGLPVNRVLEISNDGDVDLTVSVNSLPEGFTASSQSLAITQGNSAELTLTFTPIEVKSYDGPMVLSFEGLQETVGLMGEGMIITSIDEDVLRTESIKVFPNPASEQVTIDLSELPARALDIQILNPVGHAVFNRDAYQSDSLQLNVSSYRNGLYILTFTDGKSVVRKKLMIKK